MMAQIWVVGFTGKRQTHDLYAVGEDRPDVVNCAPKRYRDGGISFPKGRQVAGNRPGRNEENPIGQVLTGQKTALAQRLLTKISDPGAAKNSGSFLDQKIIVNRAPMNSQKNCDLRAVLHPTCRQARQRSPPAKVLLPGGPFGELSSMKGRYTSRTTLHYRLSLKRRTIQTMPHLLLKPSV